MQPPTPYNRTTFAVPSPSHRPRHSASNSNLRGGPPVTPIPRLLAAAAAVATSKTWVLHDGDVTGGVGLLVLALFGGRIWREVVERRGDRKGKRKEVGGAEVLSLTQVGSAAMMVGQAVAFFLAIRKIGPLRGSLVAITASIVGALWKDDPGPRRRPFPFVPAILASAFVVFDAHKLHDPECLINLFTLIALTLFLCGPCASSLELRNRTKAGSWGRLGRLSVAFGVSAISLVGLVYLNVLPSPHLLAHTPIHHLILPLATAALAAYAPLPFAPTYDPKPAARLRAPRDYLIYLLAIITLQFFALHPLPSTIDVLVLLPLVLSTIYLRPTPEITVAKPTSVKDWKFTPTPISPAGSWSYWDIMPRAWKPHFQTILHTESSRKIFYFLVINLAYMGVQMGYGVMTNSLGLISDAIHMFFDCLGIGIGLWASVAATWKPDGRYTFGYSRVETLSGFTNGLFLILISIFIIFEAIQRIMDPPEMEMRQLLLVSSVGLGINLFGMWATGGHHHHGHSHGHGHDHGHAHVHHKKEDHMHEHNRQHDEHSHNDHGHGHSAHNHTSAHKESTSSDQLPHARRRSSGKGSKDPTLHAHHPHEHSGPCNDHAHHNHDSHDSHHHDSHEHHDRHGHDCHDKHDHEHTRNENHDHAHDHSNGHSHSHSHDHDSHDNAHTSESSHSHHGHAHSHNMRGVFLHVMADTLGSVGVIISTLMIKYTGWTVFDPIASLFIAALIMASVIPLVIDSGRVLCLDVGVDCEKDIQTALGDLANVEGLASFSAPRFWPRNEGELVGSIHIQLALSPSAYDPSKSGSSGNNKGAAIYANADKVVARVEKMLKSRVPGLVEMVIQIEGSEERVYCDCMTGG